jgi:hypothetical protein
MSQRGRRAGRLQRPHLCNRLYLSGCVLGLLYAAVAFAPAAAFILHFADFDDDGIARSRAAVPPRNGMDAPARHGIRCAKVEALCSTT